MMKRPAYPTSTDLELTPRSPGAVKEEDERLSGAVWETEGKSVSGGRKFSQ